jgi:hypothetical protein
MTEKIPWDRLGKIVDRLEQEPLFDLGQQLAVTPAALELCEERGVDLFELLKRHQHGDWGDMCAEDKTTNDRAVVRGSRIVSAYNVGEHEQVWIITEADRSVTTVLLPDDY